MVKEREQVCILILNQRQLEDFGQVFQQFKQWHQTQFLPFLQKCCW